MKPSFDLLRPRLANPSAERAATTVKLPERDLLVARKQELSRDLERLQSAAKGEVDKRLESLVSAVRRDTSGRPAPVTGAVTVRVLGASCSDRKPVPLPKLRVIVETAAGASAEAFTDVTGLVVLVPRAPEAVKPGASVARDAMGTANDKFEYRLRVLASDGSTVAQAETDPTHTHLLHLGEQKSLEGHAVLGRGWLTKLDEVSAARSKLAQAVEKQIAGHAQRARDRLAAIDERLRLQAKKT